MVRLCTGVQVPAERCWISGTAVTAVVKFPMWCRDSNSSPLQEQRLLLTAEPSSHPHSTDILSSCFLTVIAFPSGRIPCSLLHLTSPTEVGSSPLTTPSLPRLSATSDEGWFRSSLFMASLMLPSSSLPPLASSCHPGMASPSRALADKLKLSLPRSTGLQVQILTTVRVMIADGAQLTHPCRHSCPCPVFS